MAMRRVIGWIGGAVLLAATPALGQQPSSAQISAVKQACRSDYGTYCASVPTGGSAALQCLQQNAGSVSAPCQQALSAISGGGGQSAPPPAAAGAATSAQPPLPRLSPREQMAILRVDCGRDYATFCRGTPLGGGRAIGCLMRHLPSVSRQCQTALLATRQ